jgi:hypothetical protein
MMSGLSVQAADNDPNIIFDMKNNVPTLEIEPQSLREKAVAPRNAKRDFRRRHNALQPYGNSRR